MLNQCLQRQKKIFWGLLKIVINHSGIMVSVEVRDTVTSLVNAFGVGNYFQGKWWVEKRNRGQLSRDSFYSCLNVVSVDLNQT